MTAWLHPSDPRVTEALEVFERDYGLNIEQALLPTHWHVAMINGQPEICLTVDGMRAIALIAPAWLDPSAVWRTEQLISAMRKAYPRKDQS